MKPFQGFDTGSNPVPSIGEPGERAERASRWSPMQRGRLAGRADPRNAERSEALPRGTFHGPPLTMRTQRALPRGACVAQLRRLAYDVHALRVAWDIA